MLLLRRGMTRGYMAVGITSPHFSRDSNIGTKQFESPSPQGRSETPISRWAILTSPIGRLAFQGFHLRLDKGRSQPSPRGQLSLVFAADTNH